MKTKSGALLPLVTRLKACPSQDNRFSEKLLFEAWEHFKHTGWDRGTRPPLSVIVALLVHDEVVATLLTTAEQAQLLALGEAARDLYLQLTHPPNHLGKTIAATLKELP